MAGHMNELKQVCFAVRTVLFYQNFGTQLNFFLLKTLLGRLIESGDFKGVKNALKAGHDVHFTDRVTTQLNSFCFNSQIF